jgi:hypothetical protein
MLTTVNFDHYASRMTGKIGDIASNSDLPSEMRIGRLEAVAKVPPELALGVSRIGAHLTPEDALWR